MMMGLQFDQPWLKGQRSTLTFKLIYSQCIIRLNISRENNEFGFHIIQKINFSKKKNIPFKYFKNKFDLDVKYVKVILGSSFEQTWEALHPQCYIPSPKVTSFLVLEKNIKRYLPYMGMAVIFVM